MWKFNSQGTLDLSSPRFKLALLLLLGCRDKAELIKAAVLHLKSGLKPKLKIFF